MAIKDTNMDTIPVPAKPEGFAMRVRNYLENSLKGDKTIWLITMLLILASVVFVYSSTSSLAFKSQKGNWYYLIKQLVFIASGVLIMFWVHTFKYQKLAIVAKTFLYIAIALLLYTKLFGQSTNDASRWIRVPGIGLTLQASDVGRLALFIYLSLLLSRKQEVIKSWKYGFLPILIPISVVSGLVFLDNFSTGVLLFGTCMILCFIGRVRLRQIMVIVGVASIPVLILLVAATKYYDKDKEVIALEKLPKVLSVGRVPTWISRIQTFIYPAKKNGRESDHQINQAKIAIANGGVFGKFPGNSTQKNFLPDAFSDFIFAIVLEETGLLGGLSLIALYLWFLYRSIRIFKRCPYAFGAFLALGLSFTLVIQALVNMAVAVNLFPVTGVTLPLVSMGGTSLVFNCVSIGIILGVARYVEELEEDPETANAIA
jgi:cell division protein FtsW